MYFDHRLLNHQVSTATEPAKSYREDHTHDIRPTSAFDITIGISRLCRLRGQLISTETVRSLRQGKDKIVAGLHAELLTVTVTLIRIGALVYQGC